MKFNSLPCSRLLRRGSLAVACTLLLPLAAEAKGPKDHANKQDKHKPRHSNSGQDDRRDDHRSDDSDRRRIYSSGLRSAFVLTLGTGYAGRGYYYGPPNSSYYYERSDVRYYPTREAAPREYDTGYHGRSQGASVQRELANRGYYQGSIDGAIGPQSSRAIARYQQDEGLRPTGTITTGLLESLGL